MKKKKLKKKKVCTISNPQVESEEKTIDLSEKVYDRRCQMDIFSFDSNSNAEAKREKNGVDMTLILKSYIRELLVNLLSQQKKGE